jgi:hypothetical protein
VSSSFMHYRDLFHFKLVYMLYIFIYTFGSIEPMGLQSSGLFLKVSVFTKF